MNIKTIEKILKDVVTEWCCNDCEAVVKNNNVYSQTTVGEFIIHDKEIDNKYDVYVEEWGDWDSYIVYKGTNTKVSEEDKKEYDRLMNDATHAMTKGMVAKFGIVGDYKKFTVNIKFKDAKSRKKFEKMNNIK